MDKCSPDFPNPLPVCRSASCQSATLPARLQVAAGRPGWNDAGRLVGARSPRIHTLERTFPRATVPQIPQALHCVPVIAPACTGVHRVPAPNCVGCNLHFLSAPVSSLVP